MAVALMLLSRSGRLGRVMSAMSPDSARLPVGCVRLPFESANRNESPGARQSPGFFVRRLDLSRSPKHLILPAIAVAVLAILVQFQVLTIAFEKLGLSAQSAYLLLMMFGWGAINSLDGGDSWQFIERTFDAERFFVWPILGVVVGVFWGAPYFSYALLVSAMSKRFPFMLFLVAPLIQRLMHGVK